jgi:16S rRNA (adenine1518-N6/adenine1519-N6)-dimethyltransferase
MVFARKRFGQNFLQDKHVIHSIVEALQVTADDKVIEIGPGRGALTEVLLQQLSHLTVIEIDRDLFANLKHLQHSEKLTSICQDVLTVDFSQFGNQQHLIGNLPYNISTPLLFHLLQYRKHIKDMVFMLQQEVVDRILASPNDTNFGRLSVIFQYYCHVERIIDVPPDCFDPAPKVHSAVFLLQPKHFEETIQFKTLEFIVGKAFAMRRKTLNNNFKNILSNTDWQQLDIDPTQRAQDISIDNFVKIAAYYENLN